MQRVRREAVGQVLDAKLQGLLNCIGELTGRFQAEDPNAVRLADYISETVELIKTLPASGEILVERVRSRRFAERDGKYDEFYVQRNESAARRAVERAAKGY